jgi:hypothetical protein
MDVVTAIAQALKSLFDFLTKVTPSDEIRQDNHNIKKPRLEQQEKIKILDREFKRLKNHPELNIVTSVGFVNDNLDIEDQKELIELLTSKIIAYRKKHPVIFKKWLKENNIN